MDTPVQHRNPLDPGDATARNYRYQYGYGVILLVAAASKKKDYRAIWCEQQEDFLCEVQGDDEGQFDAVQVKTRQPELGHWQTNSDAFVQSVKRFVELDARFPGAIRKFALVSNTEFLDSAADSRSARSPHNLLRSVSAARDWRELIGKTTESFENLRKDTGAERDGLFSVLKRLDLGLGPSRDAFVAVIAQEHLRELGECRELNIEQIRELTNQAIAFVERASSLSSQSPQRHYPLSSRGTDRDPQLEAKRISIEQFVELCSGFVGSANPSVPTTSATSKACEPEPAQQQLVNADLRRFVLVRPNKRRLFASYHSWVRSFGTWAKPQEPPRPKDFAALFSSQERRDQRSFADAHSDVAKWLIEVNLTRTNYLPHRSALDALKTIAAKLALPVPLLYDLATELREEGKVPGIYHLQCGERASLLWEKAGRPSGRDLDFWLQAEKELAAAHPASARLADETTSLQVPLLEPEKIKVKQLLRLRAFRGLLILERVPVPKWETGEEAEQQMWSGGHVYPTPAFALLDQDEAWRTSFQNAVNYIKSLLRPWPTACDFRWSLARVDGQPLPPMLSGGHLGMSFALGLAKLARIEKFNELDFRGVSAFGAVDAEGHLKDHRYSTALFWHILEGAARAGEIYDLLTSPETAWPQHWEGPMASPIHVERYAHLRVAVRTPRPANLVFSAERKASEEIEFLTGKLPIRVHHQDVPLLREVPLARYRERQTGPLPGETAGGLPAVSEASSTNVSGNRVPFYDLEERLHGSDWTFENNLNGWQELFSDFASLCPEARSTVPCFVLIGPPGSGKSTLQQYIAWCAATGLKPFDKDARLPVRLSLRDWEEGAENHGWENLETFLANGHPASKEPGWPIEEIWRRWLQAERLILLLDGLDEIKPDGGFARRLKSWLPHWRGRFPIVLFCRNLDVDPYRNALAHWPIFGPAKFRPEQRRHFIENYPRLKGLLQTDELEAQLEHHPEMLSLADVPMLLNVICYVVDQGLKLPATRTELYSVAVDRLLERDHEPPLTKYSPNNPRHRAEARRVLAGVAARLFRENEGLKPLDPDRFDQALDEMRPPGKSSTQWEECKEDFDKWFMGRSGLVRASRAGYTFLHNQFLEFLAGEGFAADPLFARHVVEAIHRVDAWREVIKYAASRKLLQDHPRPTDVRNLLEVLAAGENPTSDLDWRKAVLAGEVIQDVGAKPLELDEPPGAVTFRQVTERLVALVERESLPENRPLNCEARKGLSVHERVHAGEVLGRLGDPRSGVGLRGDGLPDIVFVPEPPKRPLPSGTFQLAENLDRALILRPYRIARYAVTVAQYRSFMAAGGYGDPSKSKPSWWTDGGWVWRLENPGHGHPEDYDNAVFQTPNHPRVGVSWYEAAAFCAWLTLKLREKGGLKPDEVIRLPKEAEWEQAARWSEKESRADARRFPWCDACEAELLSQKCNCGHTGLGQTSAVGLFPNGDGECGAADLFGNVVEWCENVYNDCETWDVGGRRGGSWHKDYVDSSCGVPHGGLTNHRSYNCGFRCIVVLGGLAQLS